VDPSTPGRLDPPYGTFVPFVAGGGAAVRGAKIGTKAVNAIDNASDAARAIDRTHDYARTIGLAPGFRGVTVIGPRATYREFAQRIGASYLKVANDGAWSWPKNRRFLYRVAKRGDDVVFAGKFNPRLIAGNPKSALAREIKYLDKHGYEWTADYSMLVKVR